LKGDFVFLHRSLLDSRVFSDEFLLRLWVWCLLKANWKSGWYQNREIKPGQFATGRSSAANEIGVDGSKWYRGMQQLQEFGNIKITNVNNRFTVVEVVNWRLYQSVSGPQRTTDEQPMDSLRTTDGQPVNTIEEGKKGRREENNENEFMPPTSEEVQSYIDERSALNPNWPRATDLTGEAFVDHYDGQGWVTGSNIPIKDWKAKVRVWGNKASKAAKRTSSAKSGSGPKTFAQQKHDNNMEQTIDFMKKHGLTPDQGNVIDGATVPRLGDGSA